MAGERDIQGIFNKVYDPDKCCLRMDIGSTSITVDATNLNVGSLEVKDATSGDTAAVTSANEIKTTDPQTLAVLQALDSLLTAIRDTSGIKKISEALPAGTNLIGKAQLSNGTLDVDISSDGFKNALRVQEDHRQEQVQTLASTTLNGGTMSPSFETLTLGFPSSALFVETNAISTVDVYYSADPEKFASTPHSTLGFSSAGFELTSIPRWAKYAKVRTDNSATVTVTTFRGR